MKKTVLIVQARMGSTRLPGKSMVNLCGKPLIGHILERLEAVRNVDEIVLATSELHENDPIARYAHDNNFECFRGSENDLLDRYYQCALEYNADTVLRLPADNVCPEPFAYEMLVAYHHLSGNDFSSNICGFMGQKWPDGIGVEAIEFGALEQAWKNNHDPDKREHVALNFYDYINDKLPENSQFKVGTIACPSSISRPDIVLDVNTASDLDKMRKLYEDLYPQNKYFSIKDIIQWFDK